MQDSLSYIILVLMGVIIISTGFSVKIKKNQKIVTQELNNLKESINNSFNTMSCFI